MYLYQSQQACSYLVEFASSPKKIIRNSGQCLLADKAALVATLFGSFKECSVKRLFHPMRQEGVQFNLFHSGAGHRGHLEPWLLVHLQLAVHHGKT